MNQICMHKISMNQILYDETLINGGGKANKKEGWKKLQKIISGGGRLLIV